MPRMYCRIHLHESATTQRRRREIVVAQARRPGVRFQIGVSPEGAALTPAEEQKELLCNPQRSDGGQMLSAPP
jgi:hypothetical protein